MKLIKNLSDLAAKKEKEMNELRQRLKDEAEKERQAEIQKLNDKHDQGIKTVHAKMSERPGEVTTYGARRTEAATNLHGKIEKTYEKQEEVEKSGFWKGIAKCIGYVAPVVGTVVSFVAPVLAPIAAPVGAAVGAVAKIFSDNCSIL